MEAQVWLDAGISSDDMHAAAMWLMQEFSLTFMDRMVRPALWGAMEDCTALGSAIAVVEMERDPTLYCDSDSENKGGGSMIITTLVPDGATNWPSETLELSLVATRDQQDFSFVATGAVLADASLGEAQGFDEESGRRVWIPAVWDTTGIMFGTTCRYQD